LDKVGDPQRTLKEVQYLLRTGWSVWCLCASVDVDIAVERAKRRAVATGRYVPPSYIRDVGERPLRAYEALRGSGIPLSGCALLDTSVPLHKRPIVLDAHTEDLFGHPGDEVAVWPDPSDEPDDPDSKKGSST
jgi:hypothetical protein